MVLLSTPHLLVECANLPPPGAASARASHLTLLCAPAKWPFYGDGGVTYLNFHGGRIIREVAWQRGAV